MSRSISGHLLEYADCKLSSALSVKMPLSTECLGTGASARLVLTRFPDETSALSLVTLNAVRDAAQHPVKSSDSAQHTSSQQANSIATSALNRWRTGSGEADRVLGVELARAATLCHSTALSCLHDAALRLHLRRDNQKALRAIAGMLGNCGRLRFQDSNLNVHEDWLSRQLASGTKSAVEAAKVVSYASTLLAPASGELEPPLSWRVCLQIVLPHALILRRSLAACLRLAEMCCAKMESTRSASCAGCGSTVLALFEQQSEARRTFQCRNSIFVRSATVIESLASRTARSPNGDMWTRTVLERDCPWTQALWLWCRGHGSMSDSDVWKEGASKGLMDLRGSALHVATCEHVIGAFCASPITLYGMGPLNRRLSVVRSFVDELVEQAHAGSSSVDDLELVWTFAIARQLPLLSTPEYTLLRSALFPSFLRDFGTNENHRLFDFQIRVHSLLFCLANTKVSDHGASMCSKYPLGTSASSTEAALAASCLHLKRCAVLCLESVSQKDDAASSELTQVIVCLAMFSSLIASGLLAGQALCKSMSQEPLMSIAEESFLPIISKSASHRAQASNYLHSAQRTRAISDVNAQRLLIYIRRQEPRGSFGS